MPRGEGTFFVEKNKNLASLKKKKVMDIKMPNNEHTIQCIRPGSIHQKTVIYFQGLMEYGVSLGCVAYFMPVRNYAEGKPNKK